jgi:hypothetical protein
MLGFNVTDQGYRVRTAAVVNASRDGRLHERAARRDGGSGFAGPGRGGAFKNSKHDDAGAAAIVCQGPTATFLRRM